MITDKRIIELDDLVASGVKLPLPAAVIVAIEDQGGSVHLESGQVIWNAADLPMGLTPTAAAEALVDGFTEDAFWDERERRPGMGAPLTPDEVAELMAEAPADFFAAVMEYEQVGPQYTQGLNFDSVEDDRIGD